MTDDLRLKIARAVADERDRCATAIADDFINQCGWNGLSPGWTYADLIVYYASVLEPRKATT